MDGFCEGPCQLEIWFSGFHPDEVSVFSERETTSDYRIQTWFYPIEAFTRALAGGVLAVALIHITGDEISGKCICAGNDDARYSGHICCEPGCIQGANMLLGGDQYLATQVTTLLFACELVFPVSASRTGLNHRPHEFIGVQGAAKSGLSIGDYRCQPVPACSTFGCFDL